MKEIEFTLTGINIYVVDLNKHCDNGCNESNERGFYKIKNDADIANIMDNVIKDILSCEEINVEEIGVCCTSLIVGINICSTNESVIEKDGVSVCLSVCAKKRASAKDPVVRVWFKMDIVHDDDSGDLQEECEYLWCDPLDLHLEGLRYLIKTVYPYFYVGNEPYIEGIGDVTSGKIREIDNAIKKKVSK